jgi:Lon protease-like protein
MRGATLTGAFMSSPHLPIFPLNTVLFPGGLLPLRVFETRYMDMARDCLRHERPFGVCLIREGREVGAPAIPEPVGCLARITDWDMQQLGVLHLKTLGGQRFRTLATRTGAQGLVSADIELIPPEDAVPLPENFVSCARLLELAAAGQDRPIFAEPHEFQNAAWVGYRLAEILPVPLAAKQKLLELTDSLARLEILQRFLEQRGLLTA